MPASCCVCLAPAPLAYACVRVYSGSRLQIDVGSLNGSTLNGVALTSNRKPSAPHPLTSGDTVTFGSVTKLKVVCAPSHVRKQPAAGGANGSKAAAPSAAAPQPQQASRQAAYSTAPGGAIAAAAAARGSDPGAVIAAAAGGAGAGVGVGQHRTFGANAADVVRRPGMSAQMLQTLHFVGPPLAVRHHAELGVSLAVQQRLGSDHRLTNTGETHTHTHMGLPGLVDGVPSTLNSEE